MADVYCPTCEQTFTVTEGVSVFECPYCGDGLLIEDGRAVRASGAVAPMMWYYVDAERRRVGPVIEERAIKLVQRGVITAETLVWHQGLPDWQLLTVSRLGVMTGVGSYAGAYRARSLPQGLAVAGLVTGIVGLALSFPCMSCASLLGLPVDIVAMILSGVALQKIKAGKAGGRGLALAGLICSIAGVGVILLVLLIFAIGMAGGSDWF